MKSILTLLLLLLILSCASQYTKTETGLKYSILKKGKGEKAKDGDKILLYETTSYRDGTVLYSNENSDHPIKIEIGAGQVTAAVDEGLRGMRTGEVRQLIATPDLVKRTFYPENTSPDSTLVIKMILHKILPNIK